MFQRMIDDFKESTGAALRMTSLAAAAAMALFITTAFLCAAAFMFVLEHYGPVEACLTGAAIFLVVTAIAAGSYMVRKHQITVRAETDRRKPPRIPCWPIRRWSPSASRSSAPSAFKRLVPILAIGGVALGFLAARGHAGGARSRRSRLFFTFIPAVVPAKVAANAITTGGASVKARWSPSHPHTSHSCGYGSRIALARSLVRDDSDLIPATRFARGLQFLGPLRTEGAGKAGRRLRPQHRVQWVVRRRTRV